MRIPCWMRLGHDWSRFTKGQREPLTCVRCEKVIRWPCGNCGRVHDDRGLLFYVCTVTRTVEW